MNGDIAFMTEVPSIMGGPRTKYLTFIGECIITRRLNERTLQDELIIERADPQVYVTAELIDEIARSQPNPHARLDPAVPAAQVRFDDRLVGTLLRIDAANQTVIYRLVRYEPECNWYLAEWPD